MIETILKMLGAGGAVSQAASGIVNTASIVAVIAALTPFGIWFLHNKDEIAVSFTWGQLALVCGIVFGIAALLLKLAHYLTPPRPPGT